jgi:hypothetical protein
MRIAITLEAKWRQVLGGKASTGAKEDESSTGRVLAAGFHHLTARSLSAAVLKIKDCLYL